MRRVIATLAAACALASAGAAPLDADLRLLYGAHLGDTPPRTVLRGLQLQAGYVAEGPSASLHAAGRLRWNDACRGCRFSADWRELYVGTQWQGWSIAAGLQQEVWGRADNLRVVDLVNPLDLRDFVLPDLADDRIAVPMLRAGRRLGEWSASLVYLPWFVPNRQAPAGSDFAFSASGMPALVLPEQRPARRLRNGELGLQLSRSLEGLDLSGFLFATRDDDPVYRRLGFDAGGLLVLQPEYRRQLMAGLSLARPLPGGLTLRAEGALVPHAVRTVDRPAGDGLAASPTFTGLLGLDYLWRDWMLTAQATDRFIARWQPGELQRRHTVLYTLSASGSAMAGRLDSRVSLARYASRDDGSWLQLKATWKPDDRSAYTLGADLFWGAPQGVFGQFAAKDRITLEALYRF